MDEYIDELLSEVVITPADIAAAAAKAPVAAAPIQKTVSVIEFGANTEDLLQYPMPITPTVLTEGESNSLLVKNVCPANPRLKIRKRIMAVSEGKRYHLFVFGTAGVAGRGVTETSGAGFIKECEKYGRSTSRNKSTRTFIMATSLDLSKVFSIDLTDPIADALNEG